MILRPQVDDIKAIGFYLSKLVIGLGLCMLVPLVLGFFIKEMNPCFDFAISMLATLCIGLALNILCFTKKELGWMHSMVVVALSWICAMFIGAIPLYMSGHWASFLDACFEAMSGFATTGLVLVQDLDHLSLSHNLWRHFIMFLGGQGIILVVISFLFQSGGGALKMYIGEARDERILPNIVQTARFIWSLSLTYLVLGTFTFGSVLIAEGMSSLRAFFHGACIFMTAFDTGGFGVQSQNILYYHSARLELFNLVFMVLGAINFSLHYALWTGKRKELTKDIEIRTFCFTIFALWSLVAFALLSSKLYPNIFILFRKGFFQLLSAHTGAGHTTLYSYQFHEWSQLALLGIIAAMALGGCVGSTTGAIKSLRIGILIKTIILEIKHLMLPEASKIKVKFYHLKEMFLEDRLVRQATLVMVLYLLLYLFGAGVGTFFGNTFIYSLFESTSAAANVGLSCGITNPAMPNFLKIVYILQMWFGRLEFISVFVFIGFIVAFVRGK